MSEIEELRKELQRSQAKSLVRSAAGAWADADDAIALLASSGDLDVIETARDAKVFVADLAARKPNYLKGSSSASSRAIPAPDRTDASGAAYMSAEALYALNDPQFHELKRTNPALYARSLENWR
jgi:hypothetical protein